MGEAARAREMEQQKREAQITRLALMRTPIHDIAVTVGCDRATVYRWLNRARDRWRENAMADTAAERGRELAALDDMELQAMLEFEASRGEKGRDHKWIETRLKIMDRRAKILGLDAPTKHLIDVKSIGVIINPVIAMMADYLPPEKMAELVGQLDEYIRNEERSRLALAGLLPGGVIDGEVVDQGTTEVIDPPPPEASANGEKKKPRRPRKKKG